MSGYLATPSSMTKSNNVQLCVPNIVSQSKYNYSVSIKHKKTQDESNKDKLRNMCEFCNNTLGTEIHHLKYQKDLMMIYRQYVLHLIF